MDMAITAWLGIDIAKQKFDVALNWNTRRRAKVFRNDAEGWQALLRWLKDLGVDQVHACLEATGRYGDGLALHLHDAGHRVSVVNPAQIKHCAKLGRNKTDRADAALICDYCRLFEPAAWTPPSAALRQLRDLVRTREALTASRVEWTNRRGSGQGSTAADAAMAGVITRLEAEIVALDQAIEDAIAQNEDLRARHDLLVSVPGIATHTAAVILSEMPGCCARRGKRRLMPVSIRAIGSPARRSMRRRGSPGSATPPYARPSISRLSPRSAGTRWWPPCASA